MGAIEMSPNCVDANGNPVSCDSPDAVTTSGPLGSFDSPLGLIGPTTDPEPSVGAGGVVDSDTNPNVDFSRFGRQRRVRSGSEFITPKTISRAGPNTLEVTARALGNLETAQAEFPVLVDGELVNTVSFQLDPAEKDTKRVDIPNPEGPDDLRVGPVRLNDSGGGDLGLGGRQDITGADGEDPTPDTVDLSSDQISSLAEASRAFARGDITKSRLTTIRDRLRSGESDVPLGFMGGGGPGGTTGGKSFEDGEIVDGGDKAVGAGGVTEPDATTPLPSERGSISGALGGAGAIVLLVVAAIAAFALGGDS